MERRDCVSLITGSIFDAMPINSTVFLRSQGLFLLALFRVVDGSSCEWTETPLNARGLHFVVEPSNGRFHLSASLLLESVDGLQFK